MCNRDMTYLKGLEIHLSTEVSETTRERFKLTLCHQRKIYERPGVLEVV